MVPVQKKCTSTSPLCSRLRGHAQILVRKLLSAFANVHLSAAVCVLILYNVHPSAAACELHVTNVHPSAAIWHRPASTAFWLQPCTWFAKCISLAPFCMSAGMCLAWCLALLGSGWLNTADLPLCTFYWAWLSSAKVSAPNRPTTVSA